MWSFFSRDPAKGFPYEVGDKVSGLDSDQSIWSIHEGKQKSNGHVVSVFMCDISTSNESLKQTAQASVKRLKTLRHPNVLTFIDSLETDKCIYVVTEHVKPLKNYLEENSKNSKTMEISVSWGLHQIAKGLSFLINTVNLTHNNVCMSSMFVDAAGEWKLGGIDYMFPASGEGSNIPPIKTLPALEKYDPPERSQTSGRPKKTTKWSSDMWGLGCLIWETFNGNLPRTSSLKVIGKIPKSLVRNYCELVSANPAARPSPDKFLDGCKAPNCFMNNHFLQTNLFLEEIQIKDPHEQSTFFSDLTNHLDEFPPVYSKRKILPQLLNVFQFGSCGPSVLPPLFKLGKLLDSAEYQSQIVPCVVKLFSSTDRATRIQLLRQLPLFAEHLQPAVVNSQVFPNMVTGFMDTNPAIREQSIKGMLLLAPKLNDNNLNNELMKHFARLQARDEQGPIRTNTTVCLGKIVPFLNSVTRHKVISSAFARAMKDPFPAARIAGILAMCNTVQYFTTTDCACRALPSLCALTVDPDKQVRENAFKTIQVFLDKLQAASNDPEEAEKMNQAAATAPPSSGNTSGWTGWMTTGVSSFTSKLYTNKANPAMPTETAKPSANPASENTEKTSRKSSTSAAEESPEPEAENGWEDNNEWDNCEELRGSVDKMSLSSSRSSVKHFKPKNLVTSQQLRSMEENIWHELHEPAKKDVAEEKDEDQDDDAYEGWDDSGWDKPSPQEETHRKHDSWGGGWDEEEWDSQPVATSSKFSIQSNISASIDFSQEKTTPSSSYNWNAKEEGESFFDEFAPLSKKTQDLSIGQKSKNVKTKPMKSSRPAARSNVAAKPTTKSKSNDWDDNDWGDDGWEDDNDSGMTKAEKMKQEREEKRKLRQKQLQEKRAAKGGMKLGARKRD